MFKVTTFENVSRQIVLSYAMSYHQYARQPPRVSARYQGFEGFYNIAITPACRLTLDVQVVQSVLQRLNTATILGLRSNFEF